MSDDKKYYYLKLKDNFFDREEITVIESMPNGYKYSNILLKMYLKSLKREGKLMVTDYIPYNLKTLSAVLKHDQDTLRAAIEVFKDFRLIEVLDNGQIYMNDLQTFVGTSSSEADRKRVYRARIEDEIKQLPNGQMSGQMSDQTSPELKLEQELKLKLEKEYSLNCFNELWEIYPKKKSKADAIKAWNKLKLNNILFDQIITGLRLAINSKDWVKDNGQFIPYPATWINGERWTDEIKVVTNKKDTRDIEW